MSASPRSLALKAFVQQNGCRHIEDAVTEAIGRLTAVDILLGNCFQREERDLEEWCHIVAHEQARYVLHLLAGAEQDKKA